MKTNTTARPTRFIFLIPIVTALGYIATSGHAPAAVTISSNVSFESGIYTYSYSVTNFGTTFDLATIDFPIALGAVIGALSAPTGFGIISDGAPVNLISLFEDSDATTTATFAPDTTIGTFRFESSTPPSLVNFSALDVSGDIYTGTTQSAIPEPSSLLFLASTVLPLLTRRHRRAQR